MTGVELGIYRFLDYHSHALTFLAEVNQQIKLKCAINRQTLIAPTEAFVTFENEQSVNVAIENPTVNLFG